MLWQRALISFTLGPLLLYLLYLGGWFFFLPIAALLLAAAWEYSHLARLMQRSVPVWWLAPAVLVVLATARLAPQTAVRDWVNLVLAVGLFIGLLYALRLYERGGRPQVAADWAFGALGLIWLGWLGVHFLLLRDLDPAVGSAAWKWSAFAILATWGSDTWAFLVGSYLAGKRLLGRHALAPRLSPKKSVEGYWGGILIGVPFNYIVGVLIFGLPWLHVLLLGLLLAVLTTAGDLAVSLLKREAGVKDSGNLFPGHGGALDRIDSLVWAVAIAYYYLLGTGVLSL